MSNEKKALEGIKQSSGTEQGEYGIDEFVSHAIQNSTFQKTETWGFLERKGYIDRIQTMGRQHEQIC